MAEDHNRGGLTQAQLAEVMGVTLSRVFKIEHGKVASVDAVVRYVQALGAGLDLAAKLR